jgi:hypothetical protein
MFHLEPLNNAAKDALANKRGLIQSKSGLVIEAGKQAFWKRRLLPIFRKASGGDVLTPSGARRVVIGFDGAAPLSASEIKVSLTNPASGAFPVFDVTPKSGKFLLRVSQIALALGLVYLTAGAFVGVVLPAGLHYIAIYYGGSDSPATRTKIKKVIDDFAVLKEPKLDERTQKFFDAIKALKAGANKEQAK